MNSPPNPDESQALETARACVVSKLSPLPNDEADLVESGALDSMAWVDTLISIESATGIQDFGNPWPTNRPKSIRALEEMIRESALPEAESPVDLRSVAQTAGKIVISGWACVLGSRRLSAQQIESELGLPPHKIRDGAGIHSVCLASDAEDELTIACRAAEAALEMASASIDKIDLLVVSSATHLGFPSLSASLHSKMLMRETSAALDVGGACAGLLHSLAVAKSLLTSRRAGVALVVAAEVHSRSLSAPRVPRDFRGLFGDGACAFVLSNSGGADLGGNVSLREFVWGCSSAHASSLSVRVSSDAGLNVQFRGEQLAQAAVSQLHAIIGSLENLSGKHRSKVDYFAIHQPNPRVVAILAQKAAILPERIPMVAKDCGNLGSVTCGASLCHALADWRGSGNRSRIPLIFMAAVAPGLVWAGAYLN